MCIAFPTDNDQVFVLHLTRAIQVSTKTDTIAYDRVIECDSFLLIQSRNVFDMTSTAVIRIFLSNIYQINLHIGF